MARLPLGQILIKRGAASREQLMLAWEQKVLFGDRLGTNLLAERLAEEKDIALALGEQHQVHAAWGEVLRVDRRAVGLVKRSIVERHGVVPHHVDGRTLFLLMSDPDNLHAIDDVTATTKLTVTPVVVCEARMWQLLQEHYGISRSLRPVPLDGDAFRLPQRVAPAQAAPTPFAAATPQLTGEVPFQLLYTPPPSSPVAGEPPAVVLQEEAPLAGVSMSAATVAPELIELQPIEEQVPLTFEEAASLLDGVHDREQIAGIVLRFALSRFRRACLLTVHSAGFAGWQAVGDCDSAALRGYRLAADEQSVFSFVVNNRAHYLGPLQKWKAHGAWVKLLGKQIPLSVVVFPVLVRGRAVNLFYADNGHNEHVSSEVGELLILAQRISRSYESLLLEAKAAF